MPGDRPRRRATEKGDELPSSHRCPMPSSIPYHIVEQEPRCTSQQIRWVDDRFGSCCVKTRDSDRINDVPSRSIAPNAARVLQQRMSVAPRKRQLATKVRRVVKGQERTSRLRFLASGSTPNRTKSWIGTALMRRTDWDDSRFSHEIGRRYRQFPDQAPVAKSIATLPLSDCATSRSNTTWPKPVRWRRHSWPAAFNPGYEKLARFRAVIFKRPRNRNPSNRN